ncbi:TPA: hypothetical protein QEK98_002972 [Stenotrophomonas maltophilia]|nr:hypothetical protein [Stenotrophomonas maltophilia]
MNLEQIDTSTTAGKIRVMELAEQGRRVYCRVREGQEGMCLTQEPSWSWKVFDYAIIAEPVGPEEVWIVHHKDGDQLLMSGKLAADEWVSNNSGDKVVRYIRADLAGEKG